MKLGNKQKLAAIICGVTFVAVYVLVWADKLGGDEFANFAMIWTPASLSAILFPAAIRDINARKTEESPDSSRSGGVGGSYSDSGGLPV